MGKRSPRKLLLTLSVVAFACGALRLSAQDTPQQPASSNPQNPNKQDAPAEAGGPGGDVGPYAIPKKKEEDATPPPRPSKPKKIEGMPDYSIKVDVPLVNLDVLVTTKDGQFIPNLKKDNFKIFEDGAPQTISNFNQSAAPITAVLLVEYASTNYNYMYEALNASYNFAATLKPEDWIAVVSVRHEAADPHRLHAGQARGAGSAEHAAHSRLSRSAICSTRCTTRSTASRTSRAASTSSWSRPDATPSAS